MPPDFELRLAETIAYCAPRISLDDPKNCLRSLESHYLSIGPMTMRGEQAVSHHRALVEAVTLERARRLEAASIHSRDNSNQEIPGRLLACDLFCSLSCGGAGNDSDEFFDWEDIPPCDTWVFHLSNQRPRPLEDFANFIVCWVPDEFVELAQAGIHCSCGWALQWLDEVEAPFTQQLREAGWTRF